MLPYLLRRVFQGAVTILVATFLLFGAITLLPGDPVRALFGFGPVDQQAYDAIIRRLHLDEPFLVQYGYFLRNTFTFQGSTLEGAAIWAIVRNAVPASAWILVGVTVVQALFAPLVVYLAGMRQGSRADRVADGTSILLVSVPVIVAAMVLHTVATSIVAPWELSDAMEVVVYQRLLPVVALGLGLAGHLALVGREELLATLQRPWVTTAHAYGLPHQRIVTRTALVPSLGPTIQLLAANLAVLVTGLIVVEGVFGVPGVGGTLLEAIRRQDRILTVTLLTIVLVTVIVVNILADLAHAWIDPRVRRDDV